MLTSVISELRKSGSRAGARRIQILRQFLLEALVVSLAGALAGIVLGLTIPVLVRPMLETITCNRHGSRPSGSLLVSCLVGLLFGYLPASQAAKSIHESLQYE